jgi:hypothetical protein
MLAITKPWRYVFFRTLTWKLRASPDDPTPVLTAAFVTVLLLWANLVTSTMLFNVYLGRRPLLPKMHRTPELYFIAAAVALGFAWLVNRAWVANGRFDRLIAEFKPLEIQHRPIRNLLYWGYIVLSVISPFLVIAIWRNS